MSIFTKWPAARLIGPIVSVGNAMEFIRRTDGFLVGDGFTNNRHFRTEYEKLSGLRDGVPPLEDFELYWNRKEKFKEAFGHVRLEHLASHWVASAYIGGPDGPVSPSGKVILVKNFGKYPSESEIEEDLTAIAENFPWLTFDLSVWGHLEEGDEGLPSNSWHLENGSWEVVEPKELKVSEPDVITSFIAGLGNPRREQTWDIGQIKHLWGSQIAEARAAAELITA